MQDKGYSNARGHILRYAGRNVHDGNGTLHPFLSGGGESRPTLFLSVSMMADKESSKETAVFSLISDIWNFMGIFAKALIPIVVYK